MNDKNLSRILGRCLDEIAAGKTVAGCLAEHPDEAAALAPLLAAAGELDVLRDYRLSEAARQSARARLLRAEVVRNEPRRAPWWQPGVFAAPRLAAALAAVLFVVLLMGGIAVATSQPGDPAYGVRVAVERASAWLTRDAESRARAELGIAARRMADLDRTMSSQDRRLDRQTLDALLASTERAAALATGLPERQRAEISARIAEQARRVAQLGQISRNGHDGAALRETAERMLRFAERTRAGVPPLDSGPAGPGAGPTQTPQQGQGRTPAAGGTPTPTAHATRQPAARPADAGTPAGPGPSATAPGPGPSVTPAGLGPSATPPGSAPGVTPPSPSATPQGPGPNATAPGPGPSPTPLGPGPNATAPGPGPSPTPLGPGPNATAPGPMPDASPEGPGPGATPDDPGSEPTSPGQGSGQ